MQLLLTHKASLINTCVCISWRKSLVKNYGVFFFSHSSKKFLKMLTDHFDLTNNPSNFSQIFEHFNKLLRIPDTDFSFKSIFLWMIWSPFRILHERQIIQHLLVSFSFLFSNDYFYYHIITKRSSCYYKEEIIYQVKRFLTYLIHRYK